MKTVFLAVLLATLSSVHASEIEITNSCDVRPYVGVCQDTSTVDDSPHDVRMVTKGEVNEPMCQFRPYVGICDEKEDN